jgi:hypothetical protein
LTFFEFLEGIEETRVLKALSSVSGTELVSEIVHQKAWELLKFYFITGGLPESIVVFKNNRSNLRKAFEAVRVYQSSLIADYLDDIAKHSGKLKSLRIAALFKSVPEQLARENKSINRFVFKDVLPDNSKYAVLEGPLEWLVKAGLVYKVSIANQALLPFQAYAQAARFKLYLLDVGLLGALTKLQPETIYQYDYGSYKGYFAENFVLNELAANNLDVCSWNEKTAEIEFLVEYQGGIYPIEVKAGLNTKAKSLKVYSQKYQPEKTFVLSGNLMQVIDAKKIHLPLYLSGSIKKFV